MKATALLATAVIAAAGLGLASCSGNGLTVKESLAHRKSVRSYTDKAISDGLLIDILWAGNGISHDGDKRTAPSAVNAQDIDMYVCKADGTYKYNAIENVINKLTDTDIRPLLQAQNAFIMSAPVTILLVSDQRKFGERREDSRNAVFGYIDAGLVSENISLYCTSVGLGTVPCAPRMDADGIRKALGLPNTSIPVLYHPIGYPAE